MTTEAGILYTRERLAEAAACCSSMDDVVAFLGTRPYENLNRYLLKRFAKFGVDTSHFALKRRNQHPADSALAEAVAGSTSYAEVLRRLGMAESGGNRRKLRGWIAAADLSTAHFLGQAHLRGRPGPTPRRKADDILVPPGQTPHGGTPAPQGLGGDRSPRGLRRMRYRTPVAGQAHDA
jgi:hypothetical protein